MGTIRKGNYLTWIVRHDIYSERRSLEESVEDDEEEEEAVK